MLRALALGACGALLPATMAVAQGRPSTDVWMVSLEGPGVPSGLLQGSVSLVSGSVGVIVRVGTGRLSLLRKYWAGS